MRFGVSSFFVLVSQVLLVGCAHWAQEKAGSDGGRKVAAQETRAPVEDKLMAIVRKIEADFPKAAPITIESTMRVGVGREVVAFTLGNGLKVIVFSDPKTPVASYQTWFRVGSRFEKPGKTGIAHLFEHLMFKGTKAYPHEVFDRLLEEAGAEVNAATWLDWTFYYENLPAESLELAVRLESDRMRGLVLTEEQLDSEREVVKNERRFRVENDPDGLMDEVLMSLVYPGHPYGWPTLGTMEDLDSITLSDCLDFYRTYYSVSNATIVVAGGVSLEDVMRLVAKYYGSYERVEVPKREVQAPEEQDEERKKELSLPIASEKLRLAWRGVRASHQDHAVFEAINAILFDGESSRVYRLLVEEKGLASEVDGAFEAFALDGVMFADVVMNEGKKAEDALEIILQEVERLGKEGPTERELEGVRNRMEAAFLRSLSTAGAKAMQLGAYEVTAGDYRLMFSFVDRIRGVTAQDVKRVVGTYMTRKRLNVVIGRPIAQEGKGGQG